MAELPKIIGHPGYQDIDGAEFSGIKGHRNVIDQSLQLVYMTPLDTKISKSINIYEGRKAKGDFIKFLNKNGVQEGQGFDGDHLTIACNNITPLSETYSNEYGQSELFGGLQQIGNGALGEFAQITGFNGKSDLEKWSQGKGALAGLASAANDTLNWATDILSQGIGEKNAKTLVNGLTNPSLKIDIPQMWKGNSFSAQYEISIRLQCFNSNSNDYYNLVVAPLIALLQFVCPRTETENFYKWPFLMEFEIPGLVDLPMAYCSSLTVIKGGDVNDLSWVWRPNIIDCRMTINTIWGVTVSSLENSEIQGRPTVKDQFDILSKIRGQESLSSIHNSSRSEEFSSEKGRNDIRSAENESASEALSS